MARVETSTIRALDTDKAVRGFALQNYIFKALVNNSTMSGDSLRWYQETATDLTATSPVSIKTDRLAQFPTFEVDWTRNVSYPDKYGVEGFISIEDIKSADVDVFARTLLRLTRAVVKQVDTVIYNVMSEDQSPSNIGTAVATGAGWDDVVAGNPILDIMIAKKSLAENNYNPEGGVIAMNPENHKDLLNYIITVKGSSIPGFATEKVGSGVVMGLLGMRVVVSNNVVANSVWVGLPKTAVTWKSFMDMTTNVETVAGIGKEIKVWTAGVAILTDPKAAFLITATD